MRTPGWFSGVVAIATVAGLAAHAPAAGPSGDPVGAAALHARVFTDDDGLPQSSVESLRFDPNGMLWATTREGGASFDGRGWTPIEMPRSAGTNWPRVTHAASDGSIWFATEGGGLHRYRDGAWARVSSPALESATITALTEGATPRPGRAIWAASPAGLFRVDTATLEVSPVQPLDGTSVTALLASARGVLAGTVTGAILLCELKWCEPEPRLTALAAGARVTGLAEEERPDGSRTTWIATDRGVAIAGPDDEALELRGKRVNAIALTRDARGMTTPWVALDGDGLLVRAEGQWHAPVLSPALPNGFAFTLAPFPTRGATRQLFVGTLNGVVRIDVASWRSIDAAAGLPDPSVVSLLEERAAGSRDYWIGTTAGLAAFRDGGWIREANILVGESPVFALLQSDDGATLYAGTHAGLVTRRDGKWSEEEASSALPRVSVVSLLETPAADGPELWAGTYGSGLWRRGARGPWTRVDGLPDARIEAIARETRGSTLRVWVATDRGLAWIEGDKVHVVDRDQGLPSGLVRSLLLANGPDGRRYVWAGTAAGLAWRDSDDDRARWRSLSRAAGAALPADNVYQVRSESPTRFWLFTGRGVVRLSFPSGAAPVPEAARIEIFSTADGLPGNECNFGASMIDSLGRIWAGTTRGAAIFDPSLAHDDTTPKTVVVTRARSVQGDIDLRARPALPHHDNDVTFALRLLDPGRGDRATYRTQMIGREHEPGEWTRDAERTFTGLAPGHYSFRAWARDASGNVSGPIEMPFSVVAPPWRSWWALLAYIAASIAALAAAHRIRVRALSTRADKLERIVRSRTRDLERMNRELEAANAALADMSVTDPLTGAKNRRFLVQEMEREATRVGRSMRSGDDLMFFVVDIDLFKNVNDTYGHTVGDAVLRQFCGTLAAAVRETDTIVRWGGEEFLVVARRSSRAEAPRIADRIIETVRAEVFDAFDGRLIQLTCSLGWAVFPFVARDPSLFAWDEVVDMADHCLLAAKASGRDCWVGLGAGPSLDPEGFFQRLRRGVPAMAEAGELEVSTSLPGPSSVHWQ